MEREIFCDCCGEPALTYDEGFDLSQWDGKQFVCKSCAVIGVVHTDYEDQRASVGFYQLTPQALSKVDFGVLVDGYEASQRLVDSLMNEIVRLNREKK